MNDKEYEKQKKRVVKLMKKWINPLGLGWWKIEMRYSRESSVAGSLDYAPPDINGTYNCIFETRSDYYYNTACITAYLPVVQGCKDEELEDYFLHELMHIFLRPMHTKETAKEEELVATKLAQAIKWVILEAKKKSVALKVK